MHWISLIEKLSHSLSPEQQSWHRLVRCRLGKQHIQRFIIFFKAVSLWPEAQGLLPVTQLPTIWASISSSSWNRCRSAPEGVENDQLHLRPVLQTHSGGAGSVLTRVHRHGNGDHAADLLPRRSRWRETGSEGAPKNSETQHEEEELGDFSCSSSGAAPPPLSPQLHETCGRLNSSLILNNNICATTTGVPALSRLSPLVRWRHVNILAYLTDWADNQPCVAV